nr:MAG: hypothetical protein [Apis mellifera filamentous virus]
MFHATFRTTFRVTFRATFLAIFRATFRVKPRAILRFSPGSYRFYPTQCYPNAIIPGFLAIFSFFFSSTIDEYYIPPYLSI